MLRLNSEVDLAFASIHGDDFAALDTVCRRARPQHSRNAVFPGPDQAVAQRRVPTSVTTTEARANKGVPAGVVIEATSTSPTYILEISSGRGGQMPVPSRYMLPGQEFVRIHWERSKIDFSALIGVLSYPRR